MGLFGKIKNIFYDEEIVEVEVPSQEVKKEDKPRIEEVRLPKKEAPKQVIREEESKPVSPLYTERELFKTETTFKFPVIDEEKEEEPIRTRTRPNILDLERSIPKREEKPYTKPQEKFPERSYSEKSYIDKSYSERNNVHNNNEKSTTTTRTFRPSPVISPVYGVLDKNYKKEEIIERQQHTVRHNPSEMNYDSVRRKAYGTLEDELESTLSKISSHKDEVMQTIKEVENLDTETNSKSIEDLLNEIEGNRDLSIGEIEEKIKDRMEEEENDSFKAKDNDLDFREEFNKKIKKPTEDNLDFSKSDQVLNTPKDQFYDDITPNKQEKTKMEEEEGFDKTLEHDLFNLIDSMYEEGKGE